MPATQLCRAAQLCPQQLMLNSCTLPKRLYPPLLFILGLFNQRRKAKIVPAALLLYSSAFVGLGSGDRNVHSQECFSSRSRAGLNLTSDLLYNDALLSSMPTLAIFTALLDSCGHSSRVRPAWKGYFSVIQSPPDKSHGGCICWKVHNGPIVNCCMSLWRGVLRDKLVIQAGQGSVQKLAGQRTKAKV